MGKIITIAGNLGAGKTTLVKLLSESAAFIPYWENPDVRPFHVDFARDLNRWALANQIDFFIYRCKQELMARQAEQVSIFDGGLDQDFHVFTRHMFNQGHLNRNEFDVCRRYYDLARELLPPPEIIIRIVIDIPTLLKRRSARQRKTVDNMFTDQEFKGFEVLLDEWLNSESSSYILPFAFEAGIDQSTIAVEELLFSIKKILPDA